MVHTNGSISFRFTNPLVNGGFNLASYLLSSPPLEATFGLFDSPPIHSPSPLTTISSPPPLLLSSATSSGSLSSPTVTMEATSNTLEKVLGPVRDPLTTTITMTIIYTIIFVTGSIGNVCTCIVIKRNKYMHTTVNYYLFSLAISDLLLLNFGLPTELYTLWRKYPYILGKPFCILRAFTSETSTNASILTITAFTVERYLAICHPLKAHTMSKLSRAIKVILIIWAISAISAIPMAYPFDIVYMAKHENGEDIKDSAICLIASPIQYLFEVATICFFVLPMGVISILYILIGLRLRRTASITSRTDSNGGGDRSPDVIISANHSQNRNTATTNKNGSSNTNNVNNHHHHHSHQQHHHTHQPQSEQQNQIPNSARDKSLYNQQSYKQHLDKRRAIVRMLVAVVVSFFICWSPFHAQRVLAIHVAEESAKFVKTALIVLTHVSGITYYLTATINPFLYQLLSLKFRLAFRDTFGFWPPFLKPSHLPELSQHSTGGGYGGGFGSVGGGGGGSHFGPTLGSLITDNSSVKICKKSLSTNGSFHSIPSPLPRKGGDPEGGSGVGGLNRSNASNGSFFNDFKHEPKSPGYTN